MKVLRYNAAVFMRRPERLQLAFKMMAIPRYVRQRERERERERKREREREEGDGLRNAASCVSRRRIITRAITVTKRRLGLTRAT